MRNVDVSLDMKEFRTTWQAMQNRYGEAVARGFRALAREARDAVRERTKSEFKLHSDYIPNGVRSTPETNSQVAAAAKGIDRHGDLEASVYLRPSSEPRRSLGFMVPHETGENKLPHGEALAILLCI